MTKEEHAKLHDDFESAMAKLDPAARRRIEAEFGDFAILYSSDDEMKILRRGGKAFWSEEYAKIAVETLDNSLPPNSFVFVCKMTDDSRITSGGKVRR